ncbi:hypothetical protein BGX23_000621 [Mortierella sp. AD031]|nr:hypothetical protein BGX23_000621 [Mortierella sp. AD031]KAG0219238.1 hypothetical protein BGX33_004051 [Mortierella sp. NVP41]
MGSALERFFSIPELAAMVGKFLGSRDLSTYMRTCRSLHALCKPFLYHTLDLCHYKTLFQSPEALQALARNMVSIHSITMGWDFLDVYFSSSITTTASPVSTNSSTVSLADTPASDSIILTSNPNTTSVPIPMVNLTCFDYSFSGNRWKAHQSLGESDGTHVTHLCHLLRQSSLLRNIRLASIRTRDDDALQALTGTISGCSRLETLELGLHVSRSQADRILTRIFFSCPQSIRTLRCKLDNWEMLDLLFDSSPFTTAGTPATSLMRERPPLNSLSDLCISGNYFDPRTEDIFAILENCPEIITLAVPRTWNPVDVDCVARFIVAHCPKLRNLSQGEYRREGACPVIFAIPGAMPKGTLESFVCASLRDQEGQIGAAFLRHSNTLVRVQLYGCEDVSSETIQAILFSCPSLEVFVATSFDFQRNAIRLEDAAAQPWASTKLQRLALFVAMGDADIPEVEWQRLSLTEQTKLSQMDKFYRQIGSLTSLVHLDLQLWTETDDNNYHNWNQQIFKHRCFPGLLTLGDGMMSSRRGWLDCLAGLSKLEVLSGSFNVRTGPDTCVIGQTEAEWIVSHWPKLQVAHFIFEGEDKYDGSEADKNFPPSMVWLKQQLPNLSIKTWA